MAVPHRDAVEVAVTVVRQGGDVSEPGVRLGAAQTAKTVILSRVRIASRVLEEYVVAEVADIRNVEDVIVADGLLQIEVVLNIFRVQQFADNRRRV